ncbi:C40 family peptidase [Neisseriaceae bacterium ESL0693]|nr:C40 family peptidase [Neisseriaceae bacterium ESL0693]
MKWVRIGRMVVISVMVLFLAACGMTKHRPASHVSSVSPSRHLQPVRITKVSQAVGGQEILMRSMSLIGTPYRYGGSSRQQGFDCSGMVQYVYQTALNVPLPRTARDIAAVSRKIPVRNLQVGDLVFFNTSGQPYSHMGLYIGQGKFIHAPSSRGVIRTASLDQAYFKQRFIDARTLFAR